MKAKMQADEADARPRRAKKPEAAASRAARFQQQQQLSVETRAEPETQRKAPPSSKKRRRRSAAEIDRKFRCPFPDCDKAYGSEGSLIHHQKLKHPEEETQEEQGDAFLSPLHTAPRNVTIRPATPLVTFAASNQSSNDMASPTDIVPPSAKAPRRNLRTRSNSEPVTVADESANIPIAAPISNPTKPRVKTPRKPRRVATPHPSKAVAAARRTKLRSKSESLPEMVPFQPMDELKMPANHRSDSSASAHEAILPIDNAVSSGLATAQASFVWPPSSIPASGHHSTSLSSDDQAIDSDILSVLANCDVEELEDSSGLDFGGGPPSNNSYQSSTSFVGSEDTEMLPVGMECFKISENATLPTETQEIVMNEPEAELGLNAFANLGDDWANDLHLSSHLEKMTMDTPPHSLESTFDRLSEVYAGRLRSASDPIHVVSPPRHGLNHFSSMPLEPFPTKSALAITQYEQSTGENELVGHELQRSTSFQQWFSGSSATEADKMEGSNTNQLAWLSSEAGVAAVGNPQPSSQALDELLQHDDTLDWKAAHGFEGDADVDFELGEAGVASTLL